MCALSDTLYHTDPHFSLSDEETTRMRAAVRKLEPQRKPQSFGTYYTHRWGDPQKIRDYYYWHKLEMEHMKRLGAIG